MQSRAGRTYRPPSRSRSTRQRTVLPLASGASASRIELLAAARSSAGWPSSARWTGPISSAPCTAASRPRPIAISNDSGHASIPMSVKPARAQNSVYALFRGERERPGIFRPLLRQFRHVLVDRLQRRHHPGVFARLAPAGERQPPGRPQRLAHVRKRQHRIGKEHHAEARGQQVKTCGIEGIDGGVRQREIDRQFLRRACPRPRQHRTRYVDAERMT